VGGIMPLFRGKRCRNVCPINYLRGNRPTAPRLGVWLSKNSTLRRTENFTTVNNRRLALASVRAAGAGEKTPGEARGFSPDRTPNKSIQAYISAIGELCPHQK